MRKSKTQRENENEGEKPEHLKGTVGTIGKRKLVGEKKKRVEGRKQPSDEMPVMSTQVLMRATALVDAN